MSHSSMRFAGRSAGVLGLGLITLALGTALAAAPASAQSCSGTLKPVSGGTGRGSGNLAAYSFACDFPVSEYRLEPQGTTTGVRDVGQGFGCQPDDPDSPQLWDCSGGAAAPGTALTGTLTNEEPPCGNQLALVVTIGRQFRLSLSISCGSNGGEGGGGGTGGGGSKAPVISALRVSPATFRAASRGSSIGVAVGTRVGYRLSVAARTTFKVDHAVTGIRSGRRCVPLTRRNRSGRRCTRYVDVRGSFIHSGRAGANSFRFTGRLAGRKLVPGTYRLAATARTSSAKSTVLHSAPFHVRR